MIQPHIQCEQVSKYILLPGDPQRVERVAEFLEEAQLVANNREFKTIKGIYKGMEVTVTSTGIGGASATIALEELIACGGKYFIRIGSSGAAQNDIAIGDLIIATAAVREDGASKMYVGSEYPAVASYNLVENIKKTSEEFEYKHHIGIVRSHDSFYIDDEMDRMKYWSQKNILGSDMETSALFVVGNLRGVEVASILNNVVCYQEDVREGINDYVSIENAAREGERKEIIVALESLLKQYLKNS